MDCRISKTSLTELFSLGDLYISDFIKDEKDVINVPKYPLTVMLSPETQCLQLSKAADKHLMYGKYWYRSGTNQTMKKELKGIVDSCLDLYNSNGRIFLDIAANDGTLLSYVPVNWDTIGIDPVEGNYREELDKNCDESVQNYFSAEVYQKSKTGKKGKASIVTCIAMFYDLEDPIKFLKDICKIMEDNGLLVIQQSYMPLMIQQLAFDNICHEHVFYHSLYSMEYILDKAGLKVVDVQLNDTNGGSFRLYIQKKISGLHSFGTSPYRDVASMRLKSLREYEKTLDLDKPDIYMNFWKKSNDLKQKTVQFIKKAKEEGKSIWVYGASTKGNTLLQWFGLNNTLISAAAERSRYKYGLNTIGTNIPIFSEEYMRSINPDYLLILPWHFIHEFKNREEEYLKKGGQFIVPCPNFEIISK